MKTSMMIGIDPRAVYNSCTPQWHLEQELVCSYDRPCGEVAEVYERCCWQRAFAQVSGSHVSCLLCTNTRISSVISLGAEPCSRRGSLACSAAHAAAWGAMIDLVCTVGRIRIEVQWWKEATAGLGPAVQHRRSRVAKLPGSSDGAILSYAVCVFPAGSKRPGQDVFELELHL